MHIFIIMKQGICRKKLSILDFEHIKKCPFERKIPNLLFYHKLEMFIMRPFAHFH